MNPSSSFHAFLHRAVHLSSDLDSAPLLVATLDNLKEVSELATKALAIPDGTFNPEKGGGEVKSGFHPQIRREGLGLNGKRAPFSVKPITSQVSINLNLASRTDLDHIKDPEEYFATIRKMELAEKELKRLRGEDCADIMGNVPNATWERRQGLPRQRLRVNHSFAAPIRRADSPALFPKGHGRSSSLFKSAIEDRHANRAENNSLDKGIQGIGIARSKISHAAEKQGSISGRVNEQTHLVDDLLSAFENIEDAQQGADFLRERLQLKPLVINKIQLSDTSDSPKSPSIDKDPLAVLFSTEKQKMHGDKTTDFYTSNASSQPCPEELFPFRSNIVDPFSPHSSVMHSGPTSSSKSASILSSVKHTSLNKETEKNNGRELNFDETLEPLNTEEIHNTVTDVIPEHPVEASFCSTEKGEDVLLEDANKQQHPGSQTLNSGNLDECERAGLDGSFENPDGVATVNVRPRRVLDFSEENVGDASNAVTMSQDLQGCSTFAGKTDARATESLGISVEQENISGPMESNLDGTTVKEKVPPVKKKQAEKKRKLLPNRRNSLAGGGTKWEGGVRRSTRRGCKPLEFWRGEKLLYARIHDTMATVVGVKRAAPGGVKVESFVSEKFADIVKKVAKY